MKAMGEVSNKDLVAQRNMTVKKTVKTPILNDF